MGCCISSEASSSARKDQLVNVGGSNESSKSRGFTLDSRAPPPSVEEETVKEVLSEIPKPKPRPNPNISANIKQEIEENKNNLHIQKPAVFAKIQENQQQQNKNVAKKQELKNMDEESMSEVSEVCSLSFSESVSTTTNITDRRDREEEQEVRQHRVMNRSPAKLTPQRNKDYGVKRERAVAQSPTRRFEQSPGKRNTTGSLRLVQSSREEPGHGQGQGQGRAMGRGKRDPGESSGRRSRSPATTRSVTMGRSPSARRTNRSPSRVKNDSVESGSSSNNNNGRKMGSPNNMEGRWPSNNNNDNNSSTNESLENPLVSLECFIFL